MTQSILFLALGVCNDAGCIWLAFLSCPIAHQGIQWQLPCSGTDVMNTGVKLGTVATW